MVSFSVGEFFFYQISGFSESVVEFVGFFAACLRHIGSAATAAVDDGCDLFEEVGCADFGGEVICYGGQQGCLVAFGETEDDDRGMGFLFEHINCGACLFGGRGREFPDDYRGVADFLAFFEKLFCLGERIRRALSRRRFKLFG